MQARRRAGTGTDRPAPGQGSHSRTGIGYLLKDGVGQAEEFVDTPCEVADGGTVIDAEAVRQLLRRRRDPPERLTPRSGRSWP